MKILWIYGKCNGRTARKHRILKNVQFIMWEADEKGNKKDVWVNFDPYWYKFFSSKEK
jgi:hypothetical protein